MALERSFLSVDPLHPFVFQLATFSTRTTRWALFCRGSDFMIRKKGLGRVVFGLVKDRTDKAVILPSRGKLGHVGDRDCKDPYDPMAAIV